ncbi:unnamed protein product [Sphagnum jensenii]|uniref:Uncharacterized protein n=1 Tax=Sphagnum jensenii TaxID=128206 RepID=A0ABP0VIC0_9BRYO
MTITTHPSIFSLTSVRSTINTKQLQELITFIAQNRQFKMDVISVRNMLAARSLTSGSIGTVFNRALELHKETLFSFLRIPPSTVSTPEVVTYNHVTFDLKQLQSVVDPNLLLLLKSVPEFSNTILLNATTLLKRSGEPIDVMSLQYTVVRDLLSRSYYDNKTVVWLTPSLLRYLCRFYNMSMSASISVVYNLTFTEQQTVATVFSLYFMQRSSDADTAEALPYIPMPAIGVQYAVFWTGYNSLFGSLIIANNTWTLTDQLANQTSVFFHVYTETGLMLPKGQTYLYYDPSSGKVFVAIKKAPYLKIVGATISDTMYLSVYRYDHAVQPITVTTFSIPSPDPGLTYTTQAVNTVIGALATTASGTFVYINGYSIVATASITINPGDYVDVYVDTTVIGSFTVDTTENTLGYASTLYGDYREVIHCPKAINPTNAIITTELLSITIRRKSDNVGLFLHRNAVNTLTQITHNDVALSTAVLNAYQTNIRSASVYVEVRVRKHTNTLIRDSHYIDYLYLCSDATIVQFLTGYGSPSLPFWTAISLEQSGYVGYMDNAPETVTTPNV